MASRFRLCYLKGDWLICLHAKKSMAKWVDRNIHSDWKGQQGGWPPIEGVANRSAKNKLGVCFGER